MIISQNVVAMSTYLLSKHIHACSWSYLQGMATDPGVDIVGTSYIRPDGQHSCGEPVPRHMLDRVGRLMRVLGQELIV